MPLWATALLVVVAVAAAPAAAQDIPTGIFVGTPDGPQEVAVYANRTPAGRVRLSVGTLDEAQRVSGAIRVICNLPLWRLRGMWLSTARVVDDDRAERRALRVRERRLSITTTFAEVVASENPAELGKLLDAVGATEDNPAYLFITMQSEGMVRDYVVGVDR
jgi:hypothetical protein